MKKIKYYIQLFGIILTQLISAQQASDNGLYYRIGHSLGNYGGGRASFEFAINNKYLLNIGVLQLGRLADNIPDDYIPPMGWVPFLKPQEGANFYYFSIGEILGQNHKYRINLSGGFGYLEYFKPDNFQPITPLESTYYVRHSKENYSYDLITNKSLALIFNPSVDYRKKYLGLSLGFYSVVALNYFSYGIEISYLFGLVKPKR